MKEIIVGENEANQKLTKLILKYLDAAPSSFVYKMLRKKNIKLNDKKADGDEMLHIGDKINIYLADDTILNFQKSKTVSCESNIANSSTDISAIKKPESLQIIYEDANIIIANKPAGMLSQKAEAGDLSVNEYLISYMKEKGLIDDKQLETFKPSICNRLDRNTSGVIIFGKTFAGSREMNQIIKTRMVHKYYKTIVMGDMKKDYDITSYHYRDSNGIAKVSKTKTGNKGESEIRTIFHPIKNGNGYTLVDVELITGKTHQIRSQLNELGFSVLGDRKYTNGKKQMNKIKYHLLHCYRIEFDDINGELSYLSKKAFIANAPDKFNKIEKELFD